MQSEGRLNYWIDFPPLSAWSNGNKCLVKLPAHIYYLWCILLELSGLSGYHWRPEKHRKKNMPHCVVNIILSDYLVVPAVGTVMTKFRTHKSLPWMIYSNHATMMQCCMLWSIFSCDQAALQMVFSVCPSVRLSLCPSHLFDYVPIIVSSWNFQELLLMTDVRSMQKFKVKGQGHRGHDPTFRFRTVTPVWIHIWWWNDTNSLMLLRRGALLFFKVIHQISRSHGAVGTVMTIFRTHKSLPWMIYSNHATMMQCCMLWSIFSCDQAALQMVFSVCPSVPLSVTPFWLCSHHRIIMKFSGVITNDRRKVHAKVQGQRSKVKVTEVTTQLFVSGL